MAIYLTDKDGSDQHYDTYEEFEQAMVLMSRIGGNKVPQDLLDEVKSKYGGKEPKPFQVQIDGSNFESAIREATRELAEALDETAKDRTPVSDECENAETEPKFEVGDKVRIISNKDDTDILFHRFRIGSIVTITDVLSIDRLDATNGDFSQVLCREHCEKIEDTEEYPTEFRAGDIVKVAETFEDSYGDALYSGDLHMFGKLSSGRVCISAVFVDGDNIDKLQLVCRKEDRKDIEL